MDRFEIPLWAVANLGKKVVLVHEFCTPTGMYLPGSEGIITGIRHENGAVFATVAIDPDDPTYLENFEFDEIRPVEDRVSFGVDMQRGVLVS